MPNKSKKRLPWEIVLVVIFSVVVVFILTKYVNLVPQVDENFFFSTNDPQVQAEQNISRSFKRRDTQLVISAEGNIKSEQYLKKIGDLSSKINSLPDIVSVLSVSTNPKSVENALKSPLWKRLLIADNQKSTNIIVVLPQNSAAHTVEAVEQLILQVNSNDFVLRISGVPYIVRLIQHSLASDFKTFSLLAFLIFTLVILLIFRSLFILSGTLLACIDAAMLTLIATHLFHIQIGLLTANLATIVLVLTLSHIIFMTNNCKNLKFSEIYQQQVTKAVRYTLSPSFWSMCTALLGFLSLFTVPAKPLRELGISGAVGTIMSMACAYTIYPVFLRRAAPLKQKANTVGASEYRLYQKFENKKKQIVFGLLILTLLMLPGLAMIKHDPSLLTYFRKNSEIAKGLRYIDRNGGSSPLIIIVGSASGSKLDTTENYNKLWQLQLSLEKHTDVGSVISLPVLMAQARQNPLSFFLTWDWLLKILSAPTHNEIAKSFTTEDHREGLFLLRMKEASRVKTRLQIIDDLKKITQDHGFIPQAVGGIYALQGQLAKLVMSSLVFGLFKLLLLFFIINWIVSRSLPLSLAMTSSLCLVPLIVLGAVGLTRLPLDIIAAPSINVAIGIGVDFMIHMVRYWRKIKAEEKTNDWNNVRKRFCEPVFNAMLILALGFGIFLFSQFPPTQRFGGIIVFGSLLSALAALYVMPWLFCYVFGRNTCKA